MEIKEIDKTFIRSGYGNSVVSCVQSLLRYFNIGFTQKNIEENLVMDDKGNVTLAEIASAFENFGLVTEGFQAEAVSNLDELSNPAIIPVFLDDGHQDFAVYYGKYANKYLVGIPFWGLNLFTEWEFEAMWDNHVLLEVRKS